MILRVAIIIIIAATLVLTGTSSETATSRAQALKEAFKSDFMIGAALNRRQFREEDTRARTIITTHFNSITPENQLKWQYVHPLPDKYDFEDADRYVAFGEKHGMHVIGHTLLWHNQTPTWVFENATRDTLLARLKDHILTVAGRYKGRIKGWDVVNEALNEDGSLRQSKWLQIIGEDYIAKAFQFAHEADPQAELYYNDYSLENEAKRLGAVRLIQKLQAQGVKVHGIGLQGHNKLDWPTAQQQELTILAFARLGLRVSITELDVDVLPPVSEDIGPRIKLDETNQEKLNPYRLLLPEQINEKQSKQYATLFGVYLKHRDVIDRVTFWGVTDGDTWLNNWPVRGRTNYPLLFDREGKPKSAFTAVLSVK